MPHITNPRIWTPRTTIKPRTQLGNKQLTFKPKLEKFSPPKEMKPPMRLSGSPRLTSEMMGDLLAQAEQWEAEANQLTQQPQDARKDVSFVNSFEAELATVLIQNSPKRAKIEELVQNWDRSGDGQISKGEWRIQVKSLGVKTDNVAEIDQLFEHYDRDRSGKIDLRELRHAPHVTIGWSVALQLHEQHGHAHCTVPTLTRRGLAGDVAWPCAAPCEAMPSLGWVGPSWEGRGARCCRLSRWVLVGRLSGTRWGFFIARQWSRRSLRRSA